MKNNNRSGQYFGLLLKRWIIFMFFLLTATFAAASLEVKVTTQLDTSTVTDNKKWPSRFTGKWWQFGNFAAGRVYGKAIRLLPGGVIDGYYHDNESRWGVENGRVVFYHTSGKPSCRFSKIKQEKGKTVMSGKFLLNDSGAYHNLREIDPPPLENVQISLGTRVTATNPDGVALFAPLPPGQYDLTIDHPGFYAYTKKVNVPSRQKKQVNIALRPVIRSDFHGIVNRKEQGAEKNTAKDALKIAGAQITFIPLDKHLTRTGKRSIISDFSGDFFLRELPSGRYQVTVTAPGFAPLKQVIKYLTGVQQPVIFSLESVVRKQQQLTVEVVDALSGKSVADADLVLAEAGEVGIVQKKRTPASGKVQMTANIGYRNLAQKNKLLLARPQLTLQISAKNYASQIIPLALPHKKLTVRLVPRVEIEEQEPNNSVTSAQKILLGTTIATRIAEVGDKDFFSFHLDYPAKVSIATTDAVPIQTYLKLTDMKGKMVAERGAYENQGNNLLAKGLPAGDYLLQVEEWGNNGMSEEKITFRVDAENAPDALEANDEASQARLINPGQEVRGSILPVGDQDWFRFRVTRPGKIRFLIPAVPFQRYLELFKEGEKERVLEAGVYENDALQQEKDLLTGEYYLRIAEWGNNNESLEPYTLRLDYLQDDGIDDPSLEKFPLRPLRSLGKNGFAASSIFPVTDKDVYPIALPSAGRLHVRGKSATQLYLRLYDKRGKILKESGSYENQENIFSYESNKPQSLYLHVEEWNNNYASTELYTLSTSWQAADDIDRRQRNDETGRATLIQPGERLRHTIFPLQDKDFYRVTIDHPGYLQVKGKAPTQLYLQWLNGKGEKLAEQGNYENQPIDFVQPVLAGAYFLQVEEWNNNYSSVQPYDLQVAHLRAEPGEKKLDDTDPPRRLERDIAETFFIDWNKDVDHFHWKMSAGEKLYLSIKNPIQTYLTLTEGKKNKVLLEKGFYEQQKFIFPIQVEKETELDLRITEWGENNHSSTPALVMLSKKEHDLPLPPLIRGIPCGENPGTTCFTVEKTKGSPLPQRITIDTNLDGRFTLPVDAKNGAESHFGGKPAIHKVAVEMVWGKDGGNITAHSQIWADSRMPGRQIGMELYLEGLKENEVVAATRPLTLFATPSSGAKLSRIEYTMDGKQLGTLHTPPFTVQLPWLTLGEGEHHFQAISYDTRGKKKTLKRTFSLSPFFGLRPIDGTQITGKNIRVSWRGSGFGSAEVRYRQRGEKKWHVVKGENGRLHSVLLRGLTSGKKYEYQAVSDGKNSEIRTISLLKGLAFGKSDYGVNVNRDYDQRVGISVRNNGDKKLQVHLECGTPSDPLLLVGFVGEGSEDKPFTLEPHEERQFMLGISAQDVNTADHSVPVRIVAESGLADEAMVNLHVRLPVIKLEWEKMGDTSYGLGQKYRVINKGDAITDLAITSSKNTFYTVPAINHGLLPAGGSTEITLYPRLYSGFTGAQDTIIAQGMGKRFQHEVSVIIPKGEKLYQTWLLPGIDPKKEPDVYLRALENVKQASKLDPEKVDWRKKELPEDQDGDGKMDRWHVFDFINNVLWIGDDSKGDGKIDFVHADQGMDGIFEFSAFRRKKGWQRTNLVEAWLEMGFSLPWSANSYKPHDVDIVFNNNVIGTLRDTIPNGNYSFRIPPNLVRFNSAGMPEGNKIGINTKHLRGGHYVVNSDYRFTFRLAASPVWSNGTTESDAYKKALDIEGLSLNAPDYSVSSSDMRLIVGKGVELKADLELAVEGKIHNLGAVSQSGVPVVLFDGSQEVARIMLDEIPMNGKISFQVPWKSVGGMHHLDLIVDPDNTTGDVDSSNNKASLLVTIPGDEKPPQLRILRPSAGSMSTKPVQDLVVQASDNQSLAKVEASIDGGLWQELSVVKKGQYQAKILLQPGEHLLRVRATDVSNNSVEKKMTLSMKAGKPSIQMPFAKREITFDTSKVKVKMKMPKDIVGAAVRIEGEPWNEVKISRGIAAAIVPLRYGKRNLEVMVVRKDGIIGTEIIQIESTRQPQKGDKRQVVSSKNMMVPITNLGLLPLLGEWNSIVGKKNIEEKEK